jgi:uncharacterized protein YyaL (SSP411 family)
VRTREQQTASSELNGTPAIPTAREGNPSRRWRCFLLPIVLLSPLFLFPALTHGTPRRALGKLPAAPPAAPEQQNTNRLASQKSPYLVEHAHDLVNWYPWGSAAFERARRENKLIFLSIGYSSCHWCHVMQRENFEDARVAKLLNQSFVAILVDREERPDIDRQYMAVCEMLTGSGGWPLHIIMTPDRRPFFAAIYIPKQSGAGKSGMLDLIPRVEQTWQRNPAELSAGGDKVRSLLEQSLNRSAPGDDIRQSSLDTAYKQLSSGFDSLYGGFGGAPKFPPPLNIFFLLRYWRRSGDSKALLMAEKTLDAMRLGGIYDQVGFGFHRYATDREWRVPHFEKMLYDQALIAMAYVEAYQATHQEAYARTAREIFAYVARDLTSPQGAFYDAQDSDSEGREGTFYLWTEKQIRDVLEKPEADLIVNAFDVGAAGNFPAAGVIAGKGENVLRLRAPLSQIASKLGISQDKLESRLESAREKLFQARAKRPHPRKDDKVLAAWNGLMIAALAKGAQALGDKRYAEAAQRAADFVLKNMRTPPGPAVANGAAGDDGPKARRLLHRYAGGEASFAADLDDYAFLTWGLLELYEATFQVPYLRAAIDLSRQMIEQFWDVKAGGLFLTATANPDDLIRQKSFDDSDLPSGNAVAALNLSRLADLTGNMDLEQKATEIRRALASAVQKSPSDYPQMLIAADFALGPSYEVVIAGKPRAADTQAMLRAAMRPFAPNKVVLLRTTEESSPEIVRLADYTRYHSAIQGKATAYVCVKYNCKLPTTDVARMLQLLGVKAE